MGVFVARYSTGASIRPRLNSRPGSSRLRTTRARSTAPPRRPRRRSRWRSAEPVGILPGGRAKPRPAGLPGRVAPLANGEGWTANPPHGGLLGNAWRVDRHIYGQPSMGHAGPDAWRVAGAGLLSYLP